MTNKDKYDKVFIDCFSLEPAQLNEQLVYQSVPTWDSVGHMGMVAAMEEAFNVSLETDDIIDISSYKKGMEILKKYGVGL